MQDQRADLEWHDDLVPVSTRFNDPYFSAHNGLAETQHVFLAGNDLPKRFKPGFHIGELGFGTGLNLLASLQMWRQTQQKGALHFTSFEAYPMRPSEMIRAQKAFPEIADIAAELAPYWTLNLHRFSLPDLEFELVRGDARTTLCTWEGQADAWFLDGFSPAKNPELWGSALMQQVGQHTEPLGTAATYSAAGFVRRNLQDAGFEVARVAGHGRKRHMTVAQLPKPQDHDLHDTDLHDTSPHDPNLLDPGLQDPVTLETDLHDTGRHGPGSNRTAPVDQSPKKPKL